MTYLEEIESKFGAAMSVFMRSTPDQGQSVAIYSAIASFNELLAFAKRSRTEKREKITFTPSARAPRMSSVCRKNTQYIETEDQFIRDNYGHKSARQIAKKLNRTVGGIRVRASVLGVKKEYHQGENDIPTDEGNERGVIDLRR